MRTPDRDLTGDYEPYGYTGYEMVLRPELAARVQDLADLEQDPKLRLGLVRGMQLPGAVGPRLERLAAQGRIEWAVDYSNLAQRMTKDRISAALFPTALHLKLRHDGELAKSFPARTLADCPPNPVGMYFSRRLPEEQRQALMAALRRLVRSGEVFRIYERFFGEAAARRMFETGRAAAGGLAV
jgi:hypothetical protein